MFEFKYTMTDEDYLELNKFHLLNSPMGKKNLLITRLIAPIMLAIIMLPKALRSNNTTLLVVSVVILLIVSFAGFFAVKPINMSVMKHHIKLMKKDGKLPYSKSGLLRFE